jgi:cytidylate kinase
MKIAVSGLSGSGNSTVCSLVGKNLRLKVINYTLRDMARELGMDFEGIHRRRKGDPAFDYQLDRKQAELFASEKNAIMGSRLAIWLVGANLSVWLEAGLKTRAARIAEREKIPVREALLRTRRRDAENALQYRRLYGIDVKTHGFVDLIVDTEKYPASKVAAIIVNEAKKAKYKKVKSSKYADTMLSSIEKGLKSIRC